MNIKVRIGEQVFTLVVSENITGEQIIVMKEITEMLIRYSHKCQFFVQRPGVIESIGLQYPLQTGDEVVGIIIATDPEIH